MQEALAREAGHDRHVGRVGTVLPAFLVQGLHHGADVRAALAPDLLHHLALQLKLRRRRGLARTHPESVSRASGTLPLTRPTGPEGSLGSACSPSPWAPSRL